jgi:hypothetical protein
VTVTFVNYHHKLLTSVLNKIGNVFKHMGSVAEWSKALVLGTSLNRREFESRHYQIFSQQLFFSAIQLFLNNFLSHTYFPLNQVRLTVCACK